MNRTLLFICICLSTLFSCRSDDAPYVGIVGEWDLIRMEAYNSEGKFSEDYSNYNIIYKFGINGKVEISGGEDIDYETGTFDYFFGKDYLAGGSIGSKVLLVKINELKYSYSLQDGEMIIGKAYVDGPNMIFKRR